MQGYIRLLEIKQIQKWMQKKWSLLALLTGRKHSFWVAGKLPWAALWAIGASGEECLSWLSARPPPSPCVDIKLKGKAVLEFLCLLLLLTESWADTQVSRGPPQRAWEAPKEGKACSQRGHLGCRLEYVSAYLTNGTEIRGRNGGQRHQATTSCSSVLWEVKADGGTGWSLIQLDRLWCPCSACIGFVFLYFIKANEKKQVVLPSFKMTS